MAVELSAMKAIVYVLERMYVDLVEFCDLVTFVAEKRPEVNGKPLTALSTQYIFS